MKIVRPLVVALLGAGVVATSLVGVAPWAGAASPAAVRAATSAGATVRTARPAVVERRVIGHSRQGREIVAYRVGDPAARRSAVVLAAMHGNELRPRVILRNLRDGAPVAGLDLWLVVTANPDGAARKSRTNAVGVDLNRNFGRRWKRSARGQTYAGPRARSEPETRALARFLRAVDPDQVVSFHQPLHGIDTSGTGNRALARRLATRLRLPTKTFSCGSGCHGTLSQWFNAKLDGQLVTVELGRHPSRTYLTRTAPRGLLAALGGRR